MVKTKAYFKRYQVKYRRRREGKTDYYARKRLVVQDKNKYNSPKYRFVVRFTNSAVICQVVYSKIQGDIVLASAYSSELPAYGVKAGLTNWSAAYCTGLLCARRLLTKVGLADKYEGVVEPEGEFAETEALEDGPRPFKCYLDVGLKRTTTGAKVFGAMKGASDGGMFSISTFLLVPSALQRFIKLNHVGLYIPHSEKRFPGYEPSSKSLDAEMVRDYIYGGHVSEYMRVLEEDDDEAYQRQFARYIEAGVGADDMEDMYSNAHADIRANPMRKKKEVSPATLAKWKAETQKYRSKKLTSAERKQKVAKFKADFLESLDA